jgi:hypothetical protein
MVFEDLVELFIHFKQAVSFFGNGLFIEYIWAVFYITA